MSTQPARIVALANQKGGVGKTTLTICGARAAAVYYGARVLVVDMDPQGNTTSTLSKEPLARDEVTIADALLPDTDVLLREVIVPTIWEGVDLAPAGKTLQAADGRIVACQNGREFRLRDALEPVLGDYDLVLVDNAPSLLGMLLINSLAAADAAVLVTEADRWSADGLALLGETLAGVRRFQNPRLEIVGTVINRWRNTAIEKQTLADIVEGMQRHFPGVPVWQEHTIPMWVSIKTTLDKGLGLDEAKESKLRVLSNDTIRPIAGQLLARPVAA